MGGVWRRLHNEELHNLYASLNIVREYSTRGSNEKCIQNDGMKLVRSDVGEKLP